MPSVCVFGPSLFLTITIEDKEDERFSRIHLHPGGQAFWIARMLSHLGELPVLVSPIGGETGQVIEGLSPLWGVRLEKVPTEAPSPAYVHDRRSGERHELARSEPAPLDRHELDDLYNQVLGQSVKAGTAVMTGKGEGHEFPLEAFTRLGADLASTEVTVVGDLHGEELLALLEGGPLDMLKVSDEELIADGDLSEEASTDERIRVIRRLEDEGARNIVLSASEGATIALLDGTMWSATPRYLQPVDPRGSGDSMTAGLVAAVSRALDPVATLQLACAAGAANVTRHGLGNVKSDLVEALAGKVEVREL